MEWAELQGILEFLLPLIILQFILMVVALIVWFKTEETRGSKWLWLFIILTVSAIGPISFFVIGRRQN
ncbi:PLDc N-terminal domain-containing protein [Amphibacillus sediminis]|uniref:PLDc N-terminal domain-containing protein n=1 Tax=Amphibacillus sediminis TaxID=360185 RepID=UPI000830ADE7|nr:PLDc N-terminal domain-containing protein [Amphibacillus sediminis]